MSGTLAVVRVESAKLRAQWRVRLAVVAVLAGPPLATVVLQAQTGLPTDTLYGRWVQEIGLAVPLVFLGSVGLFGAPVLAALVAGDILSSEDQHGTWATLLTRSRTTTQVVLGKALVAVGATVVLLVLLAASCILSGILIVGSQPLIGLTGQPLAFGTGLGLVVLSWTSTLPTTLALTATALLLGGLTRSSIVGVGGPLVLALLLHVTSLLGSLGGARPLLLVPGLDAWHGLLVADQTVTPVLVAALVAAVWTVVCTTVLVVALRRRDLAVP